MVVTGLLDLPRYLYWTQGRVVPAVLALLVVALYVGRPTTQRRAPHLRSVHDRVARPAHGLPWGRAGDPPAALAADGRPRPGDARGAAASCATPSSWPARCSGGPTSSCTCWSTRPPPDGLGGLVGDRDRVLVLPPLPGPAVPAYERSALGLRLRGRYDVVQGVKHLLPRGLGRTHGVLTVHDMLLVDRPQDFGTAKRTLLQLPYGGSIRGADTLVCVSEATRARLTAFDPAPPPAAPPSRWPPAPPC